MTVWTHGSEVDWEILWQLDDGVDQWIRHLDDGRMAVIVKTANMYELSIDGEILGRRLFFDLAAYDLELILEEEEEG